MVVDASLAAEEYTVGRWFSYKTLNTVLAASMVFMLCRYFGEGLSDKGNQMVGFISKHEVWVSTYLPNLLVANERVWLRNRSPSLGYSIMDSD